MSRPNAIDGAYQIFYSIPGPIYIGTKTSIEALTGVQLGAFAVGYTATPADGVTGFYDGSAWVWGSGGGGGVESVTGDLVDNTDPANPIVNLIVPTTTTLGGVKRNTGSAGQYVTGIDVSGNLEYDTPAGGGVESVTGDGVNNTDPLNPVISYPTPGDIGAEPALGYTPENVANKSTDVDADKTSNIKYPSVKAVYDWAVGLFVALTGNQTISGVKTFSSDPIIPDEAYGVGWDGSLEPPTKNAVYDKIQTMGGIGDGWTADANTWTFKNRTQAYTNDPAAGNSITLNMTNTADFIVGADVKVSSSAGSEDTYVTAVVANTSITVNQLLLNHTTSSPLVTLLDVFTINADVTSFIKKDTRLKFTQTTVEYGTVYSSVYSGGNTTVVMIHNTDYALANAAISATYYSNLPYPDGWPVWFNYDPEPIGWSVVPTTNVVYKYTTLMALMSILIQQPGTADATTSNSTSTRFSSPCLIINAGGTVNIQTVNNNTLLTVAARTRTGASGAGNKIIDCYTDMGIGAWAASGTKKVVCFLQGVDF